MGTSVDEGEVKENEENSPPVTKETVVPDMPPTKDDWSMLYRWKLIDTIFNINFKNDLLCWLYSNCVYL